DGEVNEKEIVELEDFYKERGSAVNIEVCTLSDISLARLLVERGFQISEYSHLHVKSLADDEPVEPDGQIAIREVRADEANEFARIVSRGFAEGGEPSDSITELFKVWFEQDNCTWFGAFIDGEPKGGGAVFVNRGVAELGGASTLPEHRGRGVQTRLLKARLAYGKKNGCDLAMVTTLPGTISQRNVEKQGFRIAYTRTKFTKQWPVKQG
ncbi:MAG TPA: GNAT family N-acetyltransferase, partial [Blastocatellia bacterium]|nr:GNAT family N-acetyltransferase [Blastocatellia bacterium]